MAAILFLVRNSLPVILMLMLLLKLGRSDYCSGIGDTGIAEKQVCDRKKLIDKAINLYSHGVPDGVSQCNCAVYLKPDTSYLSVGYFANTGGKDGCGVEVNLGNSKNYSCKSQRQTNVSSFNVIKFSRKSDSSPNMCLEIRSATPFTIRCQPSPVDHKNSEDSGDEDSDDISTTKHSTTPTVMYSSYKDSTSVHSSTVTKTATNTTRRPSTINTTVTNRKKDKNTTILPTSNTSRKKDKHTFSSASSTSSTFPTTLIELPSETTSYAVTTTKIETTSRRKGKHTTSSESSTRATISTELTELPIETSSAVNGTTVSSVLPAEEYTDTAVLVEIFVPLTVILIVMAAFCIRYKYKKHKKDSRPITEDSETAQPLDTATNNRTTEDEEATVTYNVAYGLAIPTRADNSRPNYDEDTTVTYNVAYNMDIPTNANAKNAEIPAKPDNKTELEEATVTYNVSYNLEIPPSYPINNANTHNTGVNLNSANDKAKDDDLVVTYNAMYSAGLDNEATGDSDRAAANEYKDSHIYHEINENTQDL